MAEDRLVSHAWDGQSDFVVELLTTLRHEKFRRRAWLHFLQRSWAMSWKTARRHPELCRSWLRVTIVIGGLAAGIFIASLYFESPGVSFRLLPGFLFCVVWQLSDLFWHLGLNRQVETGKLLPVLGPANMLTEMRGLGASFLLGRLLGGIGTSSSLALGIFVAGIITDMLDGQIAKRAGTQSRLGQIIDGEADFCLYLALTVILLQNGLLPLWLGLLMLLRFFIPLIAALGSYFLYAHPVRFGSTMWGKIAGMVQGLYFCVLLAPVQFAPFMRVVTLPLVIIVVLLLITAPIAQILINLRIKI